MTIYTPQLPKISLDKYAKRYKNERRRKKVMPIYEQMLIEVNKHAQPQAIYQIFQYNDLPMLHQWAAEKTVGFALGLCTLGPGIDLYAASMINRQELAAQAIMEELTLAAIVGMANDMRNKIGQLPELVSVNYTVGPAYRPGVGRWPIELQSVIFEHLPTSQIGVSINEYMVMTPGKSTSLIIPLMKKP
ncbi:MAG: hypothetical protein AAF633_13590 [Chloroflexota bacterium]